MGKSASKGAQRLAHFNRSRGYERIRALGSEEPFTLFQTQAGNEESGTSQGCIFQYAGHCRLGHLWVRQHREMNSHDKTQQHNPQQHTTQHGKAVGDNRPYSDLTKGNQGKSEIRKL